MPLGGLLPYGDEQDEMGAEGFDMPVMLTAGDITDTQDQGPEGDFNYVPSLQSSLMTMLRRRKGIPQGAQQAQGGLGGMPPGAEPNSMGAALLKGFRG